MGIWHPEIIAQAEQAEAPALVLTTPEGAAAFWIGSDERGVHVNGRLWQAGAFLPPVTLPLPPRQPRAPRAVAGTAAAVHLAWLDLDDAGALQVFSALISSADLRVLRGPTQVSSTPALRFDLYANSDGSAWVAWAGGPVGEPHITLERLDADGLPLGELAPLPSADYPSMVRLGDRLYLVWLDARTQQVYLGAIGQAGVTTVRALTPDVFLASGDRLLSLQAGADATHLSLFWNIERAGGHFETWWASGLADGSDWTQPAHLAWVERDDVLVESGFNTASLVGLVPGQGKNAMLASPLREPSAVLPVALVTRDGLGLLTIANGRLSGYQSIAAEVTIIAPPVLLADRNRHLTLGASLISDAVSAALQWWTTRP